MTALAWPSLLGALTSIERLGTTGSGLLSFRAGTGGGIFVENGRVCWAYADGLQGRLRELLRSRAAGNERPREVADGPIEFERALRLHSAESLLKLCVGNARTLWAPRLSGGYEPRFTLRPFDVLIDVVDLALPGLRARAIAEIAPLAGPGRRALSFHVDAKSSAVIPVAALSEDASVECLESFGRWAAALSAVSRELVASPSFALAANDAGQTVALWWQDELLHAVVCYDRATLAAVAAHRLAAR
jgi:hypothetical protein